MKVSVILDQSSFEIDLNEYKSAEEILCELSIDTPYKVLLCKVDNCYRSLSHKITHSCTIEYLDMRNNYAWLVYQNSLVFLYKKAVLDVVGSVRVVIENSLNKGLYTTIKCSVSKEIIVNIEKRMRELVEQQIPIIKERLSIEELVELTKDPLDKERARLIRSLSDIQDIELYSLGSRKELFYSILVPNTSYLDHFELLPYRNGILLRFPHSSVPDAVPLYEDQKLLYDAFSEATRWERLMDVNYVADLNEKIMDGKYEDLIMLQEALHEKKISDIADVIKRDNKRIILISGPSSSGKTSFAKRLCIQLQVIGLKPLYLGTDDYFLDREHTAIDENGEKDFESLRAVDVELFNAHLNALLKGERVDLPKFDFIDGIKKYGSRVISLEKNQPIIIEGIHALNELLTSGVEDSTKYKIYISPLTQLNIDSSNRIPTTDARMLRRLVRDYQFRGRDAASTIRDWPKVRKGEDSNIFPFIAQADVFFNTNYIYEIAVLKKYALPLLYSVQRDQKEYAEAQRMLSFLRFFETMEEDQMIANNSILREFIGGSVLVK